MKQALVAVLWLSAAFTRVHKASAETWLDDAGRPAYQATQSMTDGIYGFVRDRLMSERVSQQWESTPQNGSYEMFTSELKSRQLRAANGDMNAHGRATLDALTATLADRYRPQGLGRALGEILLDPNQWDVGTLASTAFFGGAYAYAAGVRTNWNAGILNLALNLSPGSSFISGSDSRRIAKFEAAARGFPFTIYAELAASSLADRFGARWSSRF